MLQLRLVNPSPGNLKTSEKTFKKREMSVVSPEVKPFKSVELGKIWHIEQN